jgi:putative ABC transport system ATP-binding protein
MASQNVVELIEATKIYRLGESALPAVDSVSLAIERGETLAIVGPSGSGKTTLLNLIACMDKPSEGKVMIEQTDTSTLDADQLAELRAERVGMVFQFFNLIPVLTAVENVEMPMVYAGIGTREERRERALEMLESMGIADKAGRYPSQLSGGERQRVSIARAVVNGPAILVADEPTGNLDSHTSKMVFESLRSLSQEGQTTLIATHDQNVVDYAGRILQMEDGRLS